jgi:hypothetical protein
MKLRRLTQFFVAAALAITFVGAAGGSEAMAQRAKKAQDRQEQVRRLNMILRLQQKQMNARRRQAIMHEQRMAASARRRAEIEDARHRAENENHRRFRR